MNVVKEIASLNATELWRNTKDSASWHAQYKDSAYIFIGGLPYELTEGDLISVFSQYGEIVDVNLVRDKQTGKSKGYAFIAYEDQRSTVLSVDNFNGIKILGRTLRVDHVGKYRGPKKNEEFDEEEEKRRKAQILPPHLQARDWTEETVTSTHSDEAREEVDEDDPMKAYFLKKAERKTKKAAKKAEKQKRKRQGGEERERKMQRER